ncbi:MAG: N-acetylmuramoyl-L-alanine amidase [Candidatus Eisenbacteria bacterium]|nr:N-acetylmuramoyl-L-alanine amidase [Candidatus Eisenbacteria bacterium]
MTNPFPRASLGALLAALILALASPAAMAELFSVDLVREGRRESTEVQYVEGRAYFLLSDVARAVVASRHWNSVTGKMSLVIGSHTVTVFSDSQFASLDGDVRNLRLPVLSLGGRLWVPASLLTGPLAEAMNSEVTVDEPALEVEIVKLGAKISGMSVDSRNGASVLTVFLNDRAPFAVRSRDRGRIDLFLPAATVADSLEPYEPSGLISSVATEQDEDGVRVTVRVTPSATSYVAEMRSAPYRLDVVVSSERQDAIPAPLLKGTRQLISGGADPFASMDSNVETVMIDPGHGGSDSGYVGRTGLAEKMANLALAEETARYLQEQGFYVFMTRSSDSEVPIKRRAEIANLSGADIFVSIHCGSWYSGGAGGFRVSYYEPAGERRYATDEARSGGLRRGSAGIGPGSDNALVWGRAQEAVADESRSLARAVHERLAESLDIRDRGVGGADLAVLAGCSMPAVMVEPAFISDPYEAALLEDDAFVRRVARAIAAGVADHRNAMRRRSK